MLRLFGWKYIPFNEIIFLWLQYDNIAISLNNEAILQFSALLFSNSLMHNAYASSFANYN